MGRELALRARSSRGTTCGTELVDVSPWLPSAGTACNATTSIALESAVFRLVGPGDLLPTPATSISVMDVTERQHIEVVRGHLIQQYHHRFDDYRIRNSVHLLVECSATHALDQSIPSLHPPPTEHRRLRSGRVFRGLLAMSRPGVRAWKSWTIIASARFAVQKRDSRFLGRYCGSISIQH